MSAASHTETTVTAGVRCKLRIHEHYNFRNKWRLTENNLMPKSRLDRVRGVRRESYVTMFSISTILLICGEFSLNNCHRGFDSSCRLPSQFSPKKPTKQVHVYQDPCCSQLPPFWHGFSSHLLITSTGTHACNDLNTFQSS